jgi:hypothetical protein
LVESKEGLKTGGKIRKDDNPESLKIKLSMQLVSISGHVY